MKTHILALNLPNALSTESLHELANLLLCVSPHIGVRPPDMIYADITTTQHLFGGAEGTATFLHKRLQKEKISAYIAVADNLPTAGVLARYGKNTSAISLSQLPLQSLLFLANPLSPLTTEEKKSTEEIIRTLSLLGIRNLGEMARIPASTMAPRFGALGVLLHQRARGKNSLPLRGFTPHLTYRESFQFEHPTAVLEPLLFAGKNLLASLEKRMQKELHAALEMVVFLEDENSEETEISIRLHKPLRNAKVLSQILRERLNTLVLTSPLIALSIEISVPARIQNTQFHLFDAYEQQGEQLDELLGRLIAKLGPSVVSAAALRERYRPEASWKGLPFEPLQTKKETHSFTQTSPKTLSSPRPSLLLSSPEPLVAKKKGGKTILRSSQDEYFISSFIGPERLQGEWWDKKEHARDYFIAKTTSGQNLWIYKTLNQHKPKVFLHGYFD